VESCCEFGTEPSYSMKCWEIMEWSHTAGGLSSSAQLHIVYVTWIHPSVAEIPLLAAVMYPGLYKQPEYHGWLGGHQLPKDSAP
jgi:hypothetical protein